MRIFPAKGSKAYDKYLGKSHINKIVYKTLFSSEVMPYPGIQALEITSTP